MGLARIEELPNGGLHVTCDGCEYRRIDGVWQMLSDSGNWFDCDPFGRELRNQIADYECCLRSYTLEQSPPYPTGRKRGESVGDFIRRLQTAELRKGQKNIFASVALRYSPPPPPRMPKAPHISEYNGWFGRRDEYERTEYAAAMKRKHEMG